MTKYLASLALALLVLTPTPLVRWPAGDATQVVQVADICLSCLDKPVHPHGSQWNHAPVVMA